MRCKKCGAELPDGARFCYMCASPVEPEEAEKNTEAAADPAQTAGAGAARAEGIPTPVKLEGPLPVGAVPFVPMAPSPRSTYVQRRAARPPKSSRPGSNSAPTTASGYSTSAWPENSAWSLEGRLPDDAGRMTERRNESDDPIGSAKNAINQVISSWSAASAERGEKKRKEKEIREAARRVQEQKREEERLAAEKAWREQEEKERREAERAQREQREQEERRELELAELREAAAAEEAMQEAAVEQVAEPADGAQVEPVAPEAVTDALSAEPFLPEDQNGEAAEELVQQPEPETEPASAEEPDDDQPTAAFEAQSDAGTRHAPDERGLTSLWGDESDDAFEAATTRDLSGATSRAEEAHKPGFAAVPRGAARASAPRNLPFNPVAVVAAVIALVAVVALGTGVLGGGQKQSEPTTPEPAQQASEPQATSEPDAEPKEAEVAVRASVEGYSWDELSQLADMIAGAKDQSSALEIEKKYNLVSAAGTLDGTQAKTLQLSDGTSVKMRIAGFRHDQRSDGSGVAGITFVSDSTVAARPINETTLADWGQSSLRSWLNGEFVSELPDDLTSKLVEVNKSTTRATELASQETTADKVWMFSYSELVGPLGDGSMRYGSYTSEGEQYQLFSDLGCVWGQNSDHYKMGGGLGRWWLRSPDPINANCYIAPNSEDGAPGYARYFGLNGEVGVAPAFCL